MKGRGCTYGDCGLPTARIPQLVLCAQVGRKVVVLERTALQAMAVCAGHAGVLVADDFISERAWLLAVEQVKAKGKPAPARELTLVEWLPVARQRERSLPPR